MIISWLTGGIGNQMFQYAAGLALAEERRTVLKLDVSWYQQSPEHASHNRYALSCFNITEQFATEEEVRQTRGSRLTRVERASVSLARLLHFNQYAARYAKPANDHQPPTFAFYPEFFDLPDPTYLLGMFQSEKFFSPVAELLRRQFTLRYPVSTEAQALAARIRQRPSIAVHFRRGDYVANVGFAQEMGTPGRGYYERAIATIRARIPDSTVFVFSDDIAAVAREFTPTGPHEFVPATAPWQAFESLWLMSQCDHFVIANSTFSWWAAWLNPAQGKVVIAPEPWFRSRRHDERDMVPASWLRLAADE